MTRSRKLQQASFRFADLQSDRLRNLPTGSAVLADIVTVAAGAADDLNAQVTVRYRGADIIVGGYVAAYTPVVGHRVICAVVDNQLIVIGRVVGYSS